MKEKIQKMVNSDLFENLLPFLTLLLIVVFFSALTGGKFLKVNNLKIIANQAVVIGLISTGAVYIYSTGNLNVAMGGVCCICCMIATQAYLATESFVVMGIVSILSALAVTGLTVLLSKLLKLSFVALTTLMMSFYSAIQHAVLATSGWQVPYTAVMPLQKMNLPLILLVAYLIFTVILFDFTPLGRNFKYIGENSTCANLTGIKISKDVAIAFLASAIGIGLGAFAYMIRNSNINIDSGTGLNMDVILAMVLAGSPMKGGSRSKSFAGVVGAFISVGLGNGLLMMGVSSFYVQIIKGVLFVIILCTTSKRPQNLPVKQML